VSRKGRGIVHERIEAPEGARRLVDDAGEAGHIEEVALDDHARARAQRVQSGGEPLGLGSRAMAVHDDVRSRRVERARDRGANAPGRSRHEDSAVVHAIF
jgi:hypothetical protein